MDSTYDYMDGRFDYEGAQISYRIVDNYSDRRVIVVKGVERMIRCIHFYDANKTLLGIRRVYGPSDELTNISWMDALRWYKEISDRKI